MWPLKGYVRLYLSKFLPVFCFAFYLHDMKAPTALAIVYTVHPYSVLPDLSLNLFIYKGKKHFLIIVSL